MNALRPYQVYLPPVPATQASLTCSLSQQATIDKLSKEVLLEIFRYYLDAYPRFWPRLVHICHKWRCIIFASPRALHLRRFCTRGTSVLKTLEYWPAIPIAVQYGGPQHSAPEDEDNIITALKQSHLVSSISLTVTSSLLEKLYAIERSFSELEDLFLLSQNSVRLTMPSAFWWGPGLRRLCSTRIAFPSLLQLLHSSRNLVDLQLHEAFNPWDFLPEALTNALSGMARLRSFSLYFLSTDNYITLPSPHKERVSLPALTHLDFRGIHIYLEDLVAGIDAPRLGDIEVTFFNESVYYLPKLREFIDRIDMHNSHSQANIISSERAISISLAQPGTPTCLKLQLICDSLSAQLLAMARICNFLSACLFNVKDLRIFATRPSNWAYYGYRQWLKLISSFTCVNLFQVAGNLSTYILRDLQLPDRKREAVLPYLRVLYIPQPGPRRALLREAVVSLITSRRLSGSPITVEYEGLFRASELRGAGTIYSQCHHHYLLTHLE